MLTPPHLLVILFTATHIQGAPLSSPVPHTAQVPLPYGLVVGNRLELVDEYLGVPYAEPPLRRFEPPVAWSSQYPSGSWRASKYSEMCLQPEYNRLLQPVGSPQGSEDCLYLNIYAPRHSGEPLPVMLWIHGITRPVARHLTACV